MFWPLSIGLFGSIEQRNLCPVGVVLLQVVRYLLHQGSDPNAVDSSDNSLLHYAAAYGKLLVIALFHN